jgi:purine-binding chemotaxis protein CheW
MQFLTFTVGKEEFGVDIMMVREVKGWSETTRLPNSPEHLRGVLNLRGIIIPIFDLRARFGGGLTEANEKNVVVIIAVSNRTLGILVDTVSDILTVGSSEIKPSPETNTGQNEKFVSGLIAVEGRMVVLLDIEMLLASDADVLETVKA